MRSEQLAVAVGVLVSLSPRGASAQSAPTCSFYAGEALLTVSVDGDPAALSVASGAINLNGTPCGAATVNNTDSITVTGAGQADLVTLSGVYRPGLTAEGDGASEIEITFAMGAGRDTVKVNGTSGADVFNFTQGGIDIGNDGDQDITTSTVELVRVFGKNGNDTIDASDYAQFAGTGVYLYGGNGNDTLVGSAKDDYLRGSAGADALHGGPGYDQLWGGAGDDLVFGEDGDDTLWAEATTDGADEYYGGAAWDRVTYDSRTNPVTVTIGNGLADDGEQGELDLVDVDIEMVIGGSGADHLTVTTSCLCGGVQDNVLDGGPGNDTLNGGDGRDGLWGGAGDDLLRGNLNDDQLLAGDGNNVLYGGAGNDLLSGGPGDDTAYGEGGRDELWGRRRQRHPPRRPRQRHH